MRERILTRAFELFMHFGIKSISMDQIAQDLGTSKKTIYKYFENKDQLIEEALTDYLGHLQTVCRHSSENALQAFCESFNLVIKKLLTFNASFFSDLRKYHYPAYQVWTNFRQQHIVEYFKNNLEAGIKAGLYRPDFDPEIMARLYVGQLENIFNGELFPAHQFHLKETYRQNLQHFILGIVSAEGLTQLNKAA